MAASTPYLEAPDGFNFKRKLRMCKGIFFGIQKLCLSLDFDQPTSMTPRFQASIHYLAVQSHGVPQASTWLVYRTNQFLQKINFGKMLSILLAMDFGGAIGQAIHEIFMESARCAKEFDDNGCILPVPKLVYECNELKFFFLSGVHHSVDLGKSKGKMNVAVFRLGSADRVESLPGTSPYAHRYKRHRCTVHLAQLRQTFDLLKPLNVNCYSVENHLGSVVKPSGFTLEQLAQNGSKYLRMYNNAAPVLAQNRDRALQLHQELQSMADRRDSDLLIPTHPSVMGVHLYSYFGLPSNPRYDKVTEALEVCDEFISTEDPKSFDDYFWRTIYASNGYFLVTQYLISSCLSAQPHLIALYLKRSHDLQSLASEVVDNKLSQNLSPIPSSRPKVHHQCLNPKPSHVSVARAKRPLRKGFDFNV
ncbi:hypothetical protein BDP27DRAFT_1370179 [Rhodocollybia butyracea]|uniref:Uncharacterized protein n=1 Tax=Rhodocollybia butyracea TaxID=206335 RepID=A0A9P5PEX6_9AGAR|nr:hypothetical protein BDP27DRAFT_1370179 [Rhodocollybia butyracea]